MGKIKKLLTNQYNDIVSIFCRYWLTLITTIVYSIFLIVMNHLNRQPDWFERMNMFLLIMIAGCMFIESIFTGSFINRTLKEKAVPKPVLIFSYIMNIALSGIWVYLSILTEKDGVFSPKTSDILGRFFAFYIILLIGYSIYEVIRQSELDFTSYCVSFVFGLVKVFSVCLAFNVGFILIFAMIEALLFEMDYSIYTDLQYVLLGFVYAPYALICLTTKKEEKGKFPKVFLMYVLMPMVFLAIAVIYAYIVKIIGRELPSNEVYTICIALFIIGGIIWTLAHGILKTHYPDHIGIYGKMVKYVPYTFFPFLILEIYCLWVRIAQYGLTTDRYYGILAIVGQIIYLLWAMIPKLLKKKIPVYENLILVILAMVFVMLICPYINVQSASFLSQKNRYETAMAEEKYADAHGAFKYLYRDTYGKAYLDTTYNESELAALIHKLEEYSATKAEAPIEYPDRIFIYDSPDDIVNIDGYRTMQSFSWTDNDVSFDEVLVEHIKLNDGTELPVVMCDVASYYMDIQAAHPYDMDIDDYVDKPYYYEVDEHHTLVITRASMTYYKYDKRFEYISFDGYILTK